MSSGIDVGDPDDDDDLSSLAAEQRRELMAFKTLDSDLDLAFHLQLEEAINASLSLQASTSASPNLPPLPHPDVKKNPPLDYGVSRNFSDLQSEQEVKDRLLSEAEFKRIRDNLHRRIHDHKLAEDIDNMTEDEWEKFGDNYEKPYGEGCSKGVNDEIVRVYFKGLVEKGAMVARNKNNSKGTFAGEALSGIGVAICDSRGELLFEVRKPLFGNGISRQSAELKALIEGFNAAMALGLKRVVFYCDYFPIYQYASGRWMPRQRKIAALVNQVILLRGKFTYCQPSLAARNDIKFAFKLAREAIVSQMNRPTESSGARSSYETCVICLEDTDLNQIFSIDGCMHRYCYSCMKQHVEVKLLHGMLPRCPHESCNSQLKIDSCSKFLTLKLVEMMKQRMKEDSIPVTEKVYCPYPKCSALMSKREVLEYSKESFIGAERTGARKCIKCSGRFCINCKVPWHDGFTCCDYKRRHPDPPLEVLKLKTLAELNLWRQCAKCNHMIELDTGCYHMTCRCGYEFCYTCGAEWKNRKATCSCPLWDEDNIMYGSDDEIDEDEDYDDEYYESYSDSDDYY